MNRPTQPIQDFIDSGFVSFIKEQVNGKITYILYGVNNSKGFFAFHKGLEEAAWIIFEEYDNETKRFTSYGMFYGLNSNHRTKCNIDLNNLVFSSSVINNLL